MSTIPLKDELPPDPAAKAPRRPSLIRTTFLRCALMLALTLILALAVFYEWTTLKRVSDNTQSVTIAAIVAALGIAACLAGMMHFLDQPLILQPPPRWFIRWPLKIAKRIVLILQLLAMALALGGAAVLIFDKQIPLPS